MSDTEIKLLPCPMCGTSFTDLTDVVYPSGIWKRVLTGENKYRRQQYVSHKDRQPGDVPCWQVVCAGSEGGCGLEIQRDTKAEAIAAWNRRTGENNGTE